MEFRHKSEPLLNRETEYQKLVQSVLKFEMNGERDEELLKSKGEAFFTSNRVWRFDEMIKFFTPKIYTETENAFNKEYNNLITEKIYFYGCPLFIYESTYDIRLNDFQKEFIDAEEIIFIEFELKKGILDPKYEFIHETSRLKIHYSLVKRLEFLEKKIEELGYKIQHSLDESKYKDGEKPIRERFEIIKITDFKKDLDSKPEVDIKKQPNWLKVGILFATGEIDILKKKFEDSTQIAKHKFPQKPDGFRSYISGSLAMSPEIPHGNNIFRDNKKIKAIFDYCSENDIKMDDKFIELTGKYSSN